MTVMINSAHVAVITRPAPLLGPVRLRRLIGLAEDEGSGDALEAIARAASALLEPPNTWVGRSWNTQTLEVRFPSFGWSSWTNWTGRSNPVRLPYPPVQSIVSIKYDDTSGVEQTLASSNYRLTASDTFADIYFTASSAWPDVYSGPESVRIQYVAGYASFAPELEIARYAVSLIAKSIWTTSQRDLSVASEDVPGLGSRTYTLPGNVEGSTRVAVENLLGPYRVMA